MSDPVQSPVFVGRREEIASLTACVAAVTPRLVDDADLPGANAVRSAIGGASIILGPALGGVLLFLGSPAFAFAVNALTFGLSALAVLAIRDRGAFTVRRSAEGPAGLSGAGLLPAGLLGGLRPAGHARNRPRRRCRSGIAAGHGGRGTRSLGSAAKYPRMTTGGRHDEFPREHRVR
jgi:hypothetical protein